ncbi:MAG TPA: DUF1190 domain-containing protein [Ferrovibrio sp.]|jgi:uncharacterized protein YgiB involved in biofilm formation|uniref:DUF1190 domain-containing protein n=1 Tax=Ferrovibrio sp. TaxID=1917215 RepID=UPI002B4B499E|nr:DUF1190 domain-containing protein [Ferrovibrio sp.]HLT79294.1 DUF1190 domain-containing protein [Ferrovibrio sp.]
MSTRIRTLKHRQRKPRAIRLVLLGTVGLIGLTACQENDPLAGHDVLRSQAECASQPDPDACRMALADARAAHVQSAPRFASRQECEDRFGADNCGTPNQILAGNDAFSAAQPAGDPAQPAPQQQAEGGSVFMPLLMGYMMGRALGGPGLGAQPLYRDPTNTAYSGNRQLGQLSTNRFPDAPRATPNSIARGGFGRTGGTYSAAS